jgi:hypothetical protein
MVEGLLSTAKKGDIVIIPHTGSDGNVTSATDARQSGKRVTAFSRVIEKRREMMKHAFES